MTLPSRPARLGPPSAQVSRLQHEFPLALRAVSTNNKVHSSFSIKRLKASNT